MRIAILAVLAFCAATAASGGVLQLRDGEKVEGDIRRSANGWEVTAADGKVRIVPEHEVVSIQTSDATAGDPRDGAQRLASLRRAVEALSDIDQILQRYEQAMKHLEGTPAADEARKDVQKWRDYQAKRMVKVGKEWLAPAAIGELEEKNLVAVEQAKALVKQSRMKDAAAIVDKVLESDQANVGALYLRGVIAHRQDQVAAARKAFEGVVAALPGHGPSLNNLAVMQWRQNATGIALTHFQRAMAAMPLDKVIHDNVAEAINALSPDARETAQLRKLQGQFQQDEPRLQAKMLESGWYRWGGTWVGEEQLKQLRDQEAQMKGELDELSRDFDETQRSIETIDDTLAANERSLARLESVSWARDEQGRMVRLAYPQSWHDFRRDNDALDLRRKRELTRLDTLRRQAQEIRSKVAVPPFTGQMRLLDEQFTPVKLRSGSSVPITE